MSNDTNICSSPKEQIKRFKVAQLAEKLMRTTIRNLAHQPAKFRPNYIRMINDYAIEIYECVNKANYYKSIDQEKLVELILRIRTNILLLDDLIEILRKENGVSEEKTTEILAIAGEFEYIFNSWAKKYCPVE